MFVATSLLFCQLLGVTLSSWTVHAFVVPSCRRPMAFVANPASSVLMSEVGTGSASAAAATEEASPAETETSASTEAETTEEGLAPVAEEIAASSEESDDFQSSEPKKKIVTERHTMFIGNLDPDATSVQLKDLFEPYGKVVLVSIPRDRETQLGRGFAFVDMSTAEELDAAVAGADGATVGSRQVRVTKSTPRGEGNQPKKPEQQELPEGQKKIYFGNIPFEMTREEVVSFFEEFGEVKDVYIPTDRQTGQGRGFAFVTMDNEAADAAIESKNGFEYEGRILVVSEPLPPGKRSEQASSRTPTTKIYIGNLSFYTTAETIKDIFEEFGDVVDCYLPEDQDTGGTRGFGFVTMGSDNAREAIAELDGCEIDGRIVRINEAQPKRRNMN